MADITDDFYASVANIGYGSQWLIGQDDGSPETFTAVAQVDSIKLGALPTGILNKTHLRSPNRTHEKIATIRDMEPFTMTGSLNLKHGSHNNAGGDGFTSGGFIAIGIGVLERNMKIIAADGSPETEIAFSGVISNLDLGELTNEGIQKFSVNVQPLQDWTGGLP